VQQQLARDRGLEGFAEGGWGGHGIGAVYVRKQPIKGEGRFRAKMTAPFILMRKP